MRQRWAILLLCMLTSSAAADMYAGLGLGRANYDGDPGKTTVMQYRVGKQLNNNFSLEANLATTTEQESDESEYSYYDSNRSFIGIGVAARIMLEPVDKFDVYLRLGAQAWENKTTETYLHKVSKEKKVYKEKEDDRDLFYGVGVRYEVASNMFAGIEHTTIEYKGKDVVEVYGFEFEFQF